MNAFRLPDLGEGLPEAEIVEWHVKVGDEVAVDQLLVSMETAKAVVDVPSPQAGTITVLNGQPGDVVRTGSVLVEFAEMTAETEAETDAGTVVGRIGANTCSSPKPDTFWLGSDRPQAKNTLAMPKVRHLATELGLELADIAGTGPGGQVLEQDLYQALETQPGHFERLSGARKAMSDAMQAAFSEVALVTLQDVADISLWPDNSDLTVRLLSAMAKACQQEPALNTWFDAKSQSRRLFDAVHVGIAVDSEHGLYVPVIDDVGSKREPVLRNELDSLIEQVKSRRMPKQPHAATITLSNFGAIGGRFATPVVTPPQVAILGVGQVFAQPHQDQHGECLSQRCLPLSLSFDHRACTGGEASRFLCAIISALA